MFLSPRSLALPGLNEGDLAIGLNYEDHALETGLPIPDEPVLFSKAITALSGPNDPVVLPPGSQKADWEVELAVIIGRSASHVSEQDAPGYVAGYAVMNDVSEREFQLERGGQWIKGKSADTFAPLGPWLVTPDEVPDPHNLGIWLDLNEERRQDGNTRTMIFTVPYLVSYVSRFLTLKPGEYVLMETVEKVNMPSDLAARVLNKSSLFRCGASTFNALVDPGFRGTLTFGLRNISDQTQVSTKTFTA